DVCIDQVERRLQTHADGKGETKPRGFGGQRTVEDPFDRTTHGYSFGPRSIDRSRQHRGFTHDRRHQRGFVGVARAGARLHKRSGFEKLEPHRSWRVRRLPAATKPKLRSCVARDAYMVAPSAPPAASQ